MPALEEVCLAGAGSAFGLRGSRLVKGANRLADVAAERPISHFVGEFWLAHARRIDGEIAEAVSRIDLPPAVFVKDCAGGTSVNAFAASSTGSDGGRIGFEWNRCEKNANEEPTSPLGIDEARVLPKPAKARHLRV